MWLYEEIYGKPRRNKVLTDVALIDFSATFRTVQIEPGVEPRSAGPTSTTLPGFLYQLQLFDVFLGGWRMPVESNPP
ncbi:hypothetical protein D3C84_890810 [compost metagenome]